MTALDQQTILITGATDGHGMGLAHELVAGGATVLVHGRAQARIDSTLAELRQADPKARVRGYGADFSSLAEVRALRFGPDVFNPAAGVWWDVTTPAQWGAHVAKYSSQVGTGIPLFIEVSDGYKANSGAMGETHDWSAAR